MKQAKIWPMVLLAAAIGSAGGIRSASAQESPTVVALRLDLVPGTTPPAGWPVTTGVPFKDGQLTEDKIASLRVETDSGKAVPAQFEVRGRHLKSRAVKWLGVSFQLDPQAKGYVLAARGSAGLAHPDPVRVGQKGAGFTVSTGGLTVEIPGAGAMLSRAWLGQELVLEQRAGDGNWLTALDGARHVERVEKATLERAGPLHTTVRVDGSYVDPQGKPSCRWTARLHFYAGRPEIGITHTFFWIGRQDKFGIRDLALSFGLKQPAVEAAADASDDTRGESVTRRLGQGESFSLLQDTHWHHGQGENHFGIYHGPADKPTEIQKGERAGGWVWARAGAGTVTLALKDLWQQFPKELSVEGQRLTAYLWRTRGAAPALDLTRDGLEKIWGPVFTDVYRSQFKPQFEQLGRQPDMLDPTGMARTHDLLLAFNSQSPAATGETFDDPPLVLPEPRWIMESDVVGRLWPRDPERFPDWEERIAGIWRDVFEIIDDWGDYGFIYWGDGSHFDYTFTKDGRPIPRGNRYTGIDAWLQHMAWLACLRSGDRRHFNYALAHSRYLGDLCTSHADTVHRWIGLTACAAGIPWYAFGVQRMSGPGPQTFYGLFPDYVFFAFYLTGDHRFMDVARSYGHHWKGFFKDHPNWKEKAAATANDHFSKYNFARLPDLAMLAEGLDEPVLMEQADAFAKLLHVPESPDGLGRDVSNADKSRRNVFPTNFFHKGMDTLKYMLVARGEPLERARQSLIRMSEAVFRTQHLEHKFIGYRMAYAYYFTKDPRYLAYAVRVLENNGPKPLPPHGRRQYTGGYDRIQVFTSMLGYAYLMGALAEAPDAAKLPVVVLLKQVPWPDAEFVFQKEAGKALAIELCAAQSATCTGPDGKPLPETWLGPTVVYYSHHDAMTAFNTHEPMLYRTLSIPPEAPAGEVRVGVKAGSQAYVFSTSATRYVFAAPRGLMVGPGLLLGRSRPPRLGLGGGVRDLWHFHVPAGTRSFRLLSSTPQELTILDPAGQPVPLKTAGPGLLEVPVAAQHAGKLWSLKAGALADVVLADVPPVFAYMDAGRHFIPRGTVSVSEPVPIPTWSPPARAPSTAEQF